MKKLITFLFLSSPLVHSQNYYQEIMENMINPCFKQVMEREGLDSRNPRLLSAFKKKHGKEVDELVQLLQSTLQATQPSEDERQELYGIGLNSCLTGN